MLSRNLVFAGRCRHRLSLLIRGPDLDSLFQTLYLFGLEAETLEALCGHAHELLAVNLILEEAFTDLPLGLDNEFEELLYECGFPLRDIKLLHQLTDF